MQTISYNILVATDNTNILYNQNNGKAYAQTTMEQDMITIPDLRLKHEIKNSNT